MDSIIIGKRKSLTSWLRQFDTIVDMEKRIYKVQQGVFGIFKWGHFKPLPIVNYVLIFKTFYAKCEDCVMDEFDDNPNSYYQVSIVYNKNRRIIVHESRRRSEAFNLAHDMAVGLKTHLRDSATNRRKSRWVF
jgi:hypothetical protein